MRVRDLMRTAVLSVTADTTVAELCDLIQQSNVHGAPVVDGHGNLVGFVTQEDILIGSLGAPPLYIGESRGAERSPAETESDARTPLVRDIMTSPAISIPEDTDVREAARTLWTFKIHHVPVVRGSRVVGIVSTMDFCGLIADGAFRETPK